jgi:lactoylglutathione lyase
VNLSYHHVSRATPDLERTLKFYAALGCVEDKRVRSDEQGLTRVVLRLPGSDALLQFIAFDAGQFTPAGTSWADHLAFHTDTFDDSLKTLLSAGGRLERAPYTLPGRDGRIGFVFDPDGYRVELVEKTL